MLRGWIPLTGTPSMVCTRHSAWLPGQSPMKPGSMSSSTVRPAHSAGTSPVTSNHHVDHARPHGSPSAKGAYSCRMASATGTGSSGAIHARRVTGVFDEYTAGVIRSSRARRIRSWTSFWFWCMGVLREVGMQAVGWARRVRPARQRR